jgi:hypothetical protein
MLDPPRLLGRRDQPAEVPRRALIARSASRRQQPLCRDPAPGLVHPSGHQLGHRVVVVLPLRALGPRSTSVVPLKYPLNGRRRGVADLGGPTLGTHLAVGGDDVHLFPRRLQWRPLGGAVTGWHRHHHRPGAHAPGRHDQRGVGTSTWPPARTLSWPRTVTLTGWMLQELTEDALVAASLTGSTTLSHPGWRPAAAAKLVRTPRRSPARPVGEPATETSSYRPLPALRSSWPGGGSCRPG